MITTTNNVPRELLSFHELTLLQQKQVELNNVPEGQEYFVYRRLVYCLQDFIRLDNNPIWGGGCHETNVSGIVIRYPTDTASYSLGDWVIVGRSCM